MKYFIPRIRVAYALLAILFFTSIFLLILFLLSEKENRLLLQTQSEKYVSLAAMEAEAAVQAYENGETAAEVYHRLKSASEYLTLAPYSEKHSEWITALREAGDTLLSNGDLSEAAGEILRRISRGESTATDITGDTEQTENTAQAYREPWENMLPFPREDGVKIAETIASAPNILHTAYGHGYVYTCDNVYVRLSAKGGIPLEMAVYTPVKKGQMKYNEEQCLLKCIQILEQSLPGTMFVRTKAPLAVVTEGYISTVAYSIGDARLLVDVRRDTGRVSAMQMILPT